MTCRTVTILAFAAAVTAPAGTLSAQEVPTTAPTTAPAETPGMGGVLKDLGESVGAGGAVKAVLVVTVLAVAPAIAVMVTCFTRIIVVLGLLRQALGTQQLPPNQVLFGLALFMTVVVMSPVFSNVHRDAIEPCSAGRISQAQAWDAGRGHVRGFMIAQIEQTGNTDDVYMFLSEDQAARDDLVWRDVPDVALVPAFVVSELKTAFLIGFRIFLPFVIIDMLVASGLLSMGMLMLPPALISLPFKLLLFVLADGWHLVVGTLMRSFG